MRRARTALASALTVLLSALAPAWAAAPASHGAGADTTAPTRPHSLRITGVGPYSVSLSWNASRDGSGSFSYVVQASNGYAITVPQTSTTATFARNLFPRNTYSLSVDAVSSTGNRSASSNSVRTTLPADATVPGTPAVTVTDVGPHHVSFAWSATDDDPYLSYFLFIDGRQITHSTVATSGTFYVPQASTAYTITVQARDHGLNFSPASAPVVFTTDPVDLTDTEPPTTPAGFDAFHYDGDRELLLAWAQSTDNVDAQQAIRYEIHVNGVLAEMVIGTGGTISYGEFGTNLITLVAFDSAGNASEPVAIVVEI